jgi:DNA-binding PadR family transcriptional regulator
MNGISIVIYVWNFNSFKGLMMIELTLNEMLILNTIRRLKENTYGAEIRRRISELTDKNWNYGTMYCILDQLEKKRFVKRIIGDPSPVPGGRKKIFYEITPSGKKALAEMFEINKTVWEGFSAPELEET